MASMTKKCITFLYIALFISTGLFSQNTINIDATQAKYRINRNIYGHFSEHLGHCIYEGLWVGENSLIPNTNGMRNDVVEALKNIKIPALRWPGGCFADEYHWKDGIGPANQRPTMINTNWGGVTEDNSFGTHEFMELCKQLECEPYISGNMGSGSIQEMSQWVEYFNSDNVSPMTDLRKANGQSKSWGVKFWGIGNESWGCGGNMRPEYYSDVAKNYGNFLRNYGSNSLNKIAVGPNGDDYKWTDVVMREMGSSIWGLSLHYYTWANGGETATNVNEANWFGMLQKTLKMEELVAKHSAVMDKYDPGKSISLVVDEWGAWYTVEPGTNPGFLFQQNTLRDALIAGINFNIFNNHCSRVRMAAVAQVVNVLQAVVLTDGEKMLLTPTYHVFDMYKVHQDALMVPSELSCENYTLNNASIPSLSVSSSIDKNGKMHVSICNLNPNKSETINCNLNGFDPKDITGTIITSDKLNAHNTFDQPKTIGIQIFKGFKLKGKSVEINLPAASVVTLEITGEFTAKAMNKVEKKDVKPGLICNSFDGAWTRIPDFSILTPVSSGIEKNFVFPNGVHESNFGLEYQGFFEAKNDGLYDFYLTSDDGAKLVIDEEDVIVHDGLHGMTERQGTVFIGKGLHKLSLAFFQGTGGSGLKVQFKAPGGVKQDIPDEMLWHK
jgi:alpha-N-arabinofuranosidase